MPSHNAKPTIAGHKRTRNPYGITLHGTPYIQPQVGMTVAHYGSLSGKDEKGTIMAVGKPLVRNGDPEVQIRTTEGRIIYLFQTALNGYRIITGQQPR